MTKLDRAILRMVDIEMSGVYREPEAAEVLRTGGDPKDGACQLGLGRDRFGLLTTWLTADSCRASFESRHATSIPISTQASNSGPIESSKLGKF